MKETKEEVVSNITLNGKKITESELEEKRVSIKEQKGAELVELSPGIFVTRFYD